MASRRRPPAGETHEEVHYLRGAALTLGAFGLALGILVVLPARSVATHSVPAVVPTGSTTTTTLPTVSTSTPTTTVKAAGYHVSVLAPEGASTTSTVTEKLKAAGDVIVPEDPIPAAWVEGYTSAVVHYPPGYESEADAVAGTVGVSEKDVSAEPSGSSDGANVIEVILPA